MKLKVAYWVVTGLVSLSATVSAFLYLTAAPNMVAAFEHLGYPDYFRTMLGIAKLLGVVALWAPGSRTLREWAYAGFAIDFVAAAVSHTAMGDPLGNTISPLVTLALLLTSHQLWHRISAGVEAAPAVHPAGA
ncbi:DoxX family protein [Myxococcus sp. CA051A]|uniref:DoxX family protein n=1 Tax=unclassified Myxococcus TaxID=2648731 RepID=UPI00157A8A0F|nr:MULTISPECIES: DoxX family protein [unclassified Myxococcus]NTX02793.1 DoxX family protein [Myxococcus sp. CA040A]NTX11214.1 DoxX family protein [Myxococcus sp. CA056]NTX34688.1 DoxX family protein [Myxococcus sp. CA033]NTX60485.1 DoxX family protein [Myxococcus sp. CA051A]